MGAKIAIASSSREDVVKYNLKVNSLTDYFDVIVGGNMVEHSKPAPDIYLEAAKRVGVAPEHCLVFEDIVTGLTAGKRAGMKLCAVEDVYSADQKEAKKAMADYYVENYLDLL